MENAHLTDSNQSPFNSAYPENYKEAIPTKKEVLDLWEIDTTEADFAIKWIDHIFRKGNSSAIVQPDEKANRKVEHLYFSAKNNERIKGRRNLGFGYPILAKKDRKAQSGIFTAPIFIWDINIEAINAAENSWEIVEKKDTKVRINPVLLSIGPEVADWVKKYEKKLANRQLTATMCQDFCAELAELLAFINEPPVSNIQKFPEIEDLVIIPNQGLIVWSGIFASFPPIHFYSFTDSILSKEFWQDQLPQEELATTYQFNLLPCDHEQKEVFYSGVKHKFILVEGAEGSGKTHTICSSIIGNLLNGQKTLILSHSVVELERILGQLINHHLEDFAFLFKKDEIDKDNLLENLIGKTDKSLKTKVVDSNEFPMAYHRFAKVRNQLKTASQTYSKNVFDIYNWTETVGLYLKNSRIESKELLSAQIPPTDFTFDFLEYDQIRDKIEKSQRRFKESFSFYHPLNDLNDSLFLNKEMSESKRTLRTQLRGFLKKAKQIQIDYLKGIGKYRSLLEIYFENYYQKLNSQIATIHHLIDELYLQFGKPRAKGLNLLSAFSSKPKEEIQLKEKIQDAFEDLQNDFDQLKYFDFEFAENTTVGKIEILEKQLLLFEKALEDWYAKRTVLIQDKINRLNNKTIHNGIAFEKEVMHLESAIQTFFEEINQSKIYSQALKNHAMTLPLKQQLLEDLIDRLKMNLHYINDFEQFFEWRKLKAHFSEKEERVIKALIKAAPKNWLAAFDTWYLHHLLLEQNQTDTDYQALLKTYFKHFKLLKEKSADFIQDLWVKERKNVILGAKKSRRNSLATFLKKPKNESAFRFYFNKQLERITHFFPIVLMTVDRAKELINHKNAFKFDALIVNDAANLTKKEGGHLLSLANRVQIYGTGRQGSLPLNQSFWSLAKSLSGKHIHLKNQHAKKGFPLLAFNKAAFGTDTNTFIDKTPLNQQSLQVYATNGLYDEELSINDGECRHMLSMLNQIKGTSWNTFPKVGFVCATKEQRNHFSSYLLKIKQKQSNGAEKIKQLERNGMGVFSFEEINDQQFDILIISFTFSPVNTAGEMSRDMDFLIATEGRAILQNLLNKGIDEIRICHSFPNSFIQSRIKDRDKPNLMLLANLIDYAQYLSQNNPKGLNKVLKRLQEDELKDREAASTIFLEEVAFHLKSYFEQNRIGQQVSINGEVYPLIIKGKNAKQPNYLIIADPFLQTSPIYSYSWQRQQHQNLMAMGYKIIAVWSRNWWRNPENEARKLASIIIKEDGAFSKES